MIQYIEFINFRNLDNKKYCFNRPLSIIVGKNGAGKTNVLDGIRLAFSALTGDYFKIEKSDFKDSDDSLSIIIKVSLEKDAIPSLIYIDNNNENACGFSVEISKTQSGRYKKSIHLLDGEDVPFDILSEDPSIPNVHAIPLSRIDNIYNDGLMIDAAGFIESEEGYKKIIDASKTQIKKQTGEKIEQFKALCKKFNQELDIDITDPRLSDEKLFVVKNEEAHGKKIGAGYKSIANIMLHIINDKYNILLIDEIENHVHPPLLRTLLRELRQTERLMTIATSHSPITINECNIEEIIDISGHRLSELGEGTVKKLNLFLHPGRGEIVFADNVILVEGYTEELLLKYYLKSENNNWTIVNVAGVMFKPYIDLSLLLSKKVIVISDNDKKNNGVRSKRFEDLLEYCNSLGVKLIEVENTLESDLVISGKLNSDNQLLQKLDNSEYYVAKDNRSKTHIVQDIISADTVLSNWHIIEEIKDGINENN